MAIGTPYYMGLKNITRYAPALPLGDHRRDVMCNFIIMEYFIQKAFKIRHEFDKFYVSYIVEVQCKLLISVFF